MSAPGGGSGVGHALAVLEEVARSGPTLSANGIARALGLPRASVYRLVNSLVGDEYLLRHPELDGFSLGVRVVELAHLVAPVRPLSSASIVTDLRRRTGAAVHLARFQHGRVIVVDEDPARPLRSLDRTRRQLASTAIGRLLLTAYAPPLAVHPDQDAVAAVVHTAQASGISPREHRDIAREVLASGIALSADAGDPPRACVAAPVHRAGERIIGALAITVESDREDHALVYRDDVIEAADRLSDVLGTEPMVRL